MQDSDTLELIRDAYKSAKGSDIALSDEVLSMVIENNDQWDDLDDEQKLAFLEMAQTQAKKVSVIDPGISALVSKFDDEIELTLTENLDAVERSKSSAVDVYAQLKRIWTLQEFSSTPFPGTEVSDVEGNELPDIVKTTDQTGKKVTTNWWNDFTFTTPRGKALENEIDDLTKELASNGSIPRLKSFSKKELTSKKATVTQRRNALRSMFKRAAALHHTLEAIIEMPLVEIEWIEEKGGIRVPVEFGKGHDCNHITVSKSPKPFWMYPTGKASEGREFSVTQIINMDVKLAIAEGGTMADLTGTLSKGAADTTGEDALGDGSDMPDDAAQATLSQFSNWFNKRDNQTLVRKKIADRAKDADGNDWLDLIGSIYLLVKPVYEQNRSAYEELIKRDTAA